MRAPPLLQCHNLSCRRPLWRHGASRIHRINASFEEGRFYAIGGAAGCGKNLLLHLLGLLEIPDEGSVLLQNDNTTALTEFERDALRQRHYGFLFPTTALLPSLSVLENIAFVVLKANAYDEAQQAELTLAALQFCELENEAEHPVSKLNLERQAVTAFARAIAHRPKILIAESPSEETVLLPLVQRAINKLSITVIWGTDEGSPAYRAADCVLSMQNGHLIS